MGSKNDGYKCDHLKSKCCEAPVRFEPKADGYSINAWCSDCGNYVYTGRTEGLISLWMMDLVAVKKNKGYIPEGVSEIVLNAMDKIKEKIKSLLI